MTFSSYILNYHKKLNVLPALSSRLLANMIDFFIALIILSPLYSIVSTIIFGGDNIVALIPDYANIQDNLEAMTELEKEQFFRKSLDNFYKNNGVLKILLNQFIQISILILLILCSWLYFKTSPGKYIMGLRIVDQETLETPSNKQLVIRALSSYLCIFTLGFGYLMLAFDKQKRALHDRLSNTIVASIKQLKNNPKAAS
jgi:uncharacterized RDD family membrane protein YckC